MHLHEPHIKRNDLHHRSRFRLSRYYRRKSQGDKSSQLLSMRTPSSLTSCRTLPTQDLQSSLHRELVSQEPTIYTETNLKCCYRKAITKKLLESPLIHLEDFCERPRRYSDSRMPVKALDSSRSFYNISDCWLDKGKLNKLRERGANPTCFGSKSEEPT